MCVAVVLSLCSKVLKTYWGHEEEPERLEASVFVVMMLRRLTPTIFFQLGEVLSDLLQGGSLVDAPERAWAAVGHIFWISVDIRCVMLALNTNKLLSFARFESLMHQARAVVVNLAAVSALATILCSTDLFNYADALLDVLKCLGIVAGVNAIEFSPEIIRWVQRERRRGRPNRAAPPIRVR